MSATRGKCSSARPRWASRAKGSATSSRKKPPRAAAVDPPQNLSEEPTLRLGVVARAFARGPARGLCCESAAALGGVEHGQIVHRLVRRPEGPRCVRARGGRAPDPSPAPQTPATVSAIGWSTDSFPRSCSNQRAERRPHLGGGPDIDEGVGSPRRLSCKVSMSPPEVDDKLAVQGHGTTCAELALLEISDEGVANPFEARRTGSVNEGLFGAGAHRVLGLTRIGGGRGLVRSGQCIAAIQRRVERKAEDVGQVQAPNHRGGSARVSRASAHFSSMAAGKPFDSQPKTRISSP